MLSTATIAEEILDLKQQRRAILLAHHYQEPEIQELADVIGDSLELARKAREFEGDVIAFCGVWFMAETAKVLNPDAHRGGAGSRGELQPGGKLPGRADPRIPAAQSRSRHRQLHQYVDRSEGGERYSLHLAQCGEDRELDSRGAADAVPAGHQPGQLREEADRPREHEDLAGRLHRACDVSRRGGWPRPSAASGREGGGASRVPAKRCWRWRTSSAPPRAIIEWCVRERRAGIHRDDRERRELFAGAGGARQEVSTSSPTRTATAASART